MFNARSSKGILCIAATNCGCEVYEPVWLIRAAGIYAGDHGRGGRGDRDVASAGDWARRVLQAAAFVADGDQVRILLSRGLQAFPGAVGGAAIDHDDFGGRKTLLHQTAKERLDGID